MTSTTPTGLFESDPPPQKPPPSALLLLALDFILLAGAFYAVHLLKYQTLDVSPRHDTLLLLSLLSWLLLGFVLGRVNCLQYKSLKHNLTMILANGGLLLGGVSFLLVVLDRTDVARSLVYGSIFGYVALELCLTTLYFRWSGRALADEPAAPTVPRSYTSVIFILADALLLGLAFVLAMVWKRGSFYLDAVHIDILLLLVGIWLISTLLNRKFEKHHFQTRYGVLTLALRSSVMMIAGLAIAVLALRYHFLSRGVLFGAAFLFCALEAVFFYLYYRYRTYLNQDGDDETVAVAPLLQQQLKAKVALDGTVCHDPVAQKLEHALQFLESDLGQFVRDQIDLEQIETSHTALLHTSQSSELQIFAPASLQLLVNIHKINDIRRLNHYLLLVHNKLAVHGYIVGKAHTLETHRAFFRSRFTAPYRRFFYALDFVWNRIAPKLPLTSKFYFAVTKGRNRLLSRAEILGRLSYCGFKPVAEIVINERFYFIGRKMKTASENPNPTFGPLVALNRSGYQGQPLKVYKFRTMHPYSEFLQDYVYEQNRLQLGGKFHNDFRVTEWGKIMRKLWLDELPMLYNWLRGDLQLIGVRPLSSQYMQLYDPDLIALRKEVKPGLLPPYYADLPKTLEEICASERRYIEAFLQHPFRTQWRYFWKIAGNIALKGARSG